MPIKVRDGGAWVEVSGGGGGSSDPVGTIVAWAGSVATIPSEYQLCDGGTASTSALQAITGTNVPDLRDRFIVGANNVSGTGTYPGVGVGSTGGSADAVVVSHTHTSPVGTAAGGGQASLQGNVAAGNINTGSASGGVSGTNANLPPYYALCYIIKHTATSGGGGSGSVVPAGSVFYFASSSTPTGYLKANGAELNKTAYAVLFSGIGTTYGETNGAGGAGTSHFRVPDLRGEFIRGWDDSRGVDSGRSFGSTQVQMFEDHKHALFKGSVEDSGTRDSDGYAMIDRSDLTTETNEDAISLASYDARYTVTWSTGTETRPRNVALLACIKY